VPRFYAWLHDGFPDVRLPKVVMFYLHDADIRIRDADYRRTQEADIDAAIEELERGRVPSSDTHAGCALPVQWWAAGALMLSITLWILLR
jgi:hypothetical protein